MPVEHVILVHGLWMTGIELSVLGYRLRKVGYETSHFSYRSVSDAMDDNVFRLKNQVARIESEQVHYVAHSLGALVVLELFLRHEIQQPGRIVGLGAPLLSSKAARRLSSWRFGKTMLGSAGEALVDPVVEQWDGRRDLGLIAGSSGFGMGRLMGPMPEPHDGSVSVAETMLPGATDHLVMSVTHTSILFNTQVLAQVINFLRVGKFQHPPPDEDRGSDEFA